MYKDLKSDAPVRYPHDLFDRIWESDSVKKAIYLVDFADGTEKIATNVSIDVNGDEMPPVKVMQTAVVGTSGFLKYRLNLDGFPAVGCAFSYLAEIEDFLQNESRKFRLVLPGQPSVSKAIVNIKEIARGKYRMYQPGFIHLENNQLTGVLPATLGNLPNLKELYVENNMLSGTVSSELLSKDLIIK
ncbi:putative non-specific serine/threonine protein kinase [Medicago truncatula]|uniref:Putative non-specific serine/threonine protein kinase n=1 Tax=Medicago truncatula TaxID=3880 RepID=A0A396HCG0_MEDTR|nr:putative non-specific serine/threonine protein kinase [Medicago truncatula]